MKFIGCKFVRTGLFLLPGFLIADATPIEECGKGPKPYLVQARHIEGKGIGYQQGYSTLDVFLPFQCGNCQFLPLLDLRGHIFNDGKWAANGGIGGRWINESGSWILGMNVFYDYRGAKRKSFNQAGVGFEAMGNRWEARVNGYLPFGGKATRGFHPKFKEFRENSIVLEYKKDVALKAIDSELGYNIAVVKHVDLFTGAGPYYLSGQLGKSSWGGKGRLTAKFTDWVQVDVTGSYDSLFHGIIQGQLGLNIPFGPRKILKKKRMDASCSGVRALQDRFIQPIVREEIIPIKRRTLSTVAKDPITGSPLFVWFVNNLSSSNGTFESPFTTLAVAESASKSGDIIYVYPGNGSPYSTGFIMKDQQRILGSSNSHDFATQLGSITISAQTMGTPIIENPADDVIVLASGNEVSGLRLIAAGSNRAIFGDAIVDANINYNLFTDTATNRMFFRAVSGMITVDHNTISAASTGDNGIVIDGNVNATIAITNNDIYNCNAGVLDTGSGGVRSIYLFNNNIEASTNALSLLPDDSVIDLTAINNNFGAAVGITSTNSVFHATFEKNTFFSSSSNTFSFTDAPAASIARTTISMSENIFEAPAGDALVFAFSDFSNAVLGIQNNNIAGQSLALSLIVTGTGNVTSCILNNEISSFFTPGILITSENTSNLCLKYVGNTGVLSDILSFTQVGASVFNVEPLVNNVGTIQTTGTVSLVSEGTCVNCQ